MSTESVDLAPDDEAELPLPAGALLAGRYEVQHVLGRGGSAVVYAVLDLAVRQRVALKLLRRERINSRSLRRMQREVRLARESVSPRLVRVFDVGDCEHGPFVTMELIEGETLRTRLARQRPSIEEAVTLARQAAEALEAIHVLGIIHRDLKPSNLLVTPAGEIKLADFGLAYRLDADESRLTQTSTIVGTLDYIAPEQALGEELDPRCDLYSLGVLLFEMVTGMLPFRGGSTIGTVIAHIQKRPPDVRRLRRDAPPWLARLITRLLERDRDRRYPTAAAVAEALRVRRSPWRPRVRAAGAVMALVALLTTATIGAWEYRQTRFTRLVYSGGSMTALDRAG